MTSIVLIAVILVLAVGAAYTQLGVRRVERALPPLGDFVEVDGLRLHYLQRGPADANGDAGQAPALILLHGASSNLRDFASSLMPVLAETHCVLAFDRPGYGYSERPEGEWPDPAQVAAMVLDAAERLGVRQPVLVGHSWAGAVVMAALVAMPERLAGGVLLSGVAGHWAGPPNRNYRIGGLPVIGPLFAHTLVYPLGNRVIDDAVREILAPEAVPEDYVTRIGARLALRPGQFLHNVEDMNRLSEYLQSLSPRYRTITKPLLLVHGDEDTLVPFWNHGERLLPVVPQARVAMLQGAGHAPHHSRPEEVVSALRDFLSHDALAHRAVPDEAARSPEGRSSSETAAAAH